MTENTKIWVQLSNSSFRKELRSTDSKIERFAFYLFRIILIVLEVVSETTETK